MNVDERAALVEQASVLREFPAAPGSIVGMLIRAADLIEADGTIMREQAELLEVLTAELESLKEDYDEVVVRFGEINRRLRKFEVAKEGQ